jgi:hypothetical protein
MTTKATIEGYFGSLKQKKDWESYLADDMVFTSFTSPIKQVNGKAAFLESTKRFYSGIITFELRDLLVEEEKACALTRYRLQPLVCLRSRAMWPKFSECATARSIRSTSISTARPSRSRTRNSASTSSVWSTSSAFSAAQSNCVSSSTGRRIFPLPAHRLPHPWLPAACNPVGGGQAGNSPSNSALDRVITGLPIVVSDTGKFGISSVVALRRGL